MRKDGNTKKKWRKILTIPVVVLNIMTAILLIVSAYSGAINPDRMAIAGVVAMTFPGWLLLMVIWLVVDLIWWRRTAILAGIVLMVCGPSIWEYTPFNIPYGNMSAEEQERSFTLLSYNVYGFLDQSGEYPGSLNPTLSYILHADADVVCLQEAMFLSPDKNHHMTAAQIDSLYDRYPYIFLNGTGQALLSKFPTEPIPIEYRREKSGGADMAAYRLEIYGHTINVFNVHLQSIGLTQDDRELYGELTRLKGEDRLGDVKSQLIGKISAANRLRAAQTRILQRLLKKYGGKNTIVCGDFNDIPGCYSLRRLGSDDHLREVYTDVGFGPMITYNSSRLYFRIDHVLYRGDLNPIKMTRGSVRSSDHYPLLSTFLWNKSD